MDIIRAMLLIKILLNLPHTLIGLILGVISGIKRGVWNKEPYAIIFYVKSLWWMKGYMKGGRACAIGNIVLLGPEIADKDLEHELVHVQQHEKYPFIFPFLYYIELIRKGYRSNKYEDEAYATAGNKHIHRMHLHPTQFERIQQGKQQIETRINDEKRRIIRIGDEIEFTSRNDSEEKFKVKVIDLIIKSTFSELYRAGSPEDYGGRDEVTYINSQLKFSSLEEEKRWGVVGIRVEIIK
jgi:ASC-1-like (ASCH) protein